jgi:methionine sulfoxide reductase heme-binding subunit
MMGGGDATQGLWQSRWIGIRTWLAIHWLAYAAWPIAFIHGFGAATDLRSGWELSWSTWRSMPAMMPSRLL